MLPSGTTLITGGASGLGLALAEACLERGHQVMIVDIDDRKLSVAARRLTDALCWRSDLADPRDRTRLVQELNQNSRDLALVIHTADLRGDYHDLDSLAGADDAAAQVAVNLTAPIDLSLKLLPLLLAQPWAAIVNVVSLSGTRHTDRALVHAAARAGLDAFGAALARRLVETEIQVHTVRRAPTDVDPADRPRHSSKATAAAILAAIDSGELDIEVS